MFKCVMVAVKANVSEEKSREGAQWSLNGIFLFSCRKELRLKGISIAEGSGSQFRFA